MTRKRAPRKTKLSIVRKLTLKNRRDDTAEGVELHAGADLEGHRGWPCSVACFMGIRILEGIIVGAGRGEARGLFWGAVGSIRKRHECIFLVVQETETCGSRRFSNQRAIISQVPLRQTRLAYAALWAVGTPYAMLFSTPCRCLQP